MFFNLFCSLLVLASTFNQGFGYHRKSHFDMLETKNSILENRHPLTKIVPTSTNLGPIGFVIDKVFLNSGSCSGTPTVADEIAAGVCFQTTAGTSFATVVTVVSSTTFTVSSVDYSDASCTVVSQSDGSTFLSSCIAISTSASTFSSFQSTSVSNFGAGTFTALFDNSNCASTGFTTGVFTANGICNSENTTSAETQTCSGTSLTITSYTSPTTCTGASVSLSETVGACTTVSSIQSMQISCMAGTSTAASSSCFAGSESVTLSNGEQKLISQVEVGDHVLAANALGDFKYAEVVAVPHATNQDPAQFTHIITASGRDIKLTADHLILAAAAPACTDSSVSPAAAASSSSFALKAASAVVVDDCLRTVDGIDRVVSVGLIDALGVYSVVTKEEFVVVNGVVASPFAGNHAAAHAFYNIHRALYSVLPSVLLSSSWLKKANEVFGVIAHSFKL